MTKESITKEIMTKESIDDFLKDVRDTLLKKNQDYGNASFDLGLIGNMVHIHDKSSRYKTLVMKGIIHTLSDSNPNFESIEDTLKDLIGYAVIGLHIIKQQEDEKANN